MFLRKKYLSSLAIFSAMVSSSFLVTYSVVIASDQPRTTYIRIYPNSVLQFIAIALGNYHSDEIPPTAPDKLRMFKMDFEQTYDIGHGGGAHTWHRWVYQWKNQFFSLEEKRTWFLGKLKSQTLKLDDRESFQTELKEMKIIRKDWQDLIVKEIEIRDEIPLAPKLIQVFEAASEGNSSIVIPTEEISANTLQSKSTKILDAFQFKDFRVPTADLVALLESCQRK